MGLFDRFKKKKGKAAGEAAVQMEEAVAEEINYQGLIEVAGILTDNDSESLSIIRLLVEDPKRFDRLWEDWLDEIDFSAETLPDLIAAYWLTGYDTMQNFGAYIDWKEETSEILWGLEPGIQTKGYLLDFDDLSFTGEEYTDEALYMIAHYVKSKGYTLVYWDTSSDCYHLFVIPANKFEPLVALGKTMKLDFKTFLEPPR